MIIRLRRLASTLAVAATLFAVGLLVTLDMVVRAATGREDA